jgi:hypothetical protein
VAVGRYTSDLERGDVLGPVEYTLSPFVVREYCHAVELHQDCFQGTRDQVMPPTLIHLDKLRLYRHACPLGTGPHARVHIEYDATFHEEVRVGDRLRVGGRVSGQIGDEARRGVFVDRTRLLRRRAGRKKENPRRAHEEGGGTPHRGKD